MLQSRVISPPTLQSRVEINPTELLTWSRLNKPENYEIKVPNLPPNYVDLKLHYEYQKPQKPTDNYIAEKQENSLLRVLLVLDNFWDPQGSNSFQKPEPISLGNVYIRM